MDKIHILGTGNAMVTKCYNTCFTLSKDKEHFLIDTGGGNGILANLEKSNISTNNIHNLFISHCHNDHITGVTWIIRSISQGILKETYKGNLNIYCHSSIGETIRTLCSLTLQKKFNNVLDKRILFHYVEHGDSKYILDSKVTFFDIKSQKDLQYGFTLEDEDGMTLTFLGDEPYRETIHEYCYNKDYIFHEAFCLYSEREIFKPYEKHHATVKDACINGEVLKAKNLILYHTEDKNILNRKKLYYKEGSEFFSGNLFIPEDLEEISLK